MSMTAPTHSVATQTPSFFDVDAESFMGVTSEQPTLVSSNAQRDRDFEPVPSDCWNAEASSPRSPSLFAKANTDTGSKWWYYKPTRTFGANRYGNRPNQAVSSGGITKRPPTKSKSKVTPRSGPESEYTDLVYETQTATPAKLSPSSTSTGAPAISALSDIEDLPSFDADGKPTLVPNTRLRDVRHQYWHRLIHIQGAIQQAGGDTGSSGAAVTLFEHLTHHPQHGYDVIDIDTLRDINKSQDQYVSAIEQYCEMRIPGFCPLQTGEIPSRQPVPMRRSIPTAPGTSLAFNLNLQLSALQMRARDILASRQYLPHVPLTDSVLWQGLRLFQPATLEHTRIAPAHEWDGPLV